MPFFYVARRTANAVNVYRTSDNTLVDDPITGLGFAPTALAVSPDGSLLLVANNESNSVTYVNTTTNLPFGMDVTVGAGPQAIAITNDPLDPFPLAYVANGNGASVTVLDVNNRMVLGTPGVGIGPVSVAVTPDDSAAYVVSITGMVSVILTDSDPPAVSTTIPVGVTPFGIAITPDGLRAYVANAGNAVNNGTFSVIDTTNNTAATPIPLNGNPQAVAIVSLATNTPTVTPTPTGVPQTATSTATPTSTRRPAPAARRRRRSPVRQPSPRR
jgi:YVTN family beta-propeller protein